MKSMRIIKLKVENFMRLKAIEIEVSPTQNIVKITGKNAAGKTSVLEAIWGALGGSRVLPLKPIRTGQERALIQLDLGELIVTRKFHVTKAGNVTTSLTVENADGAVFRSPQAILNGLLDSLSFDPLKFARMDAPAQYDSLKSFCGLDFSDEEDEIKKLFGKRTIENRLAKEAQGAAASITVPEETPEETVSVDSLTVRLQDALKFNSEIEQNRRESQRIIGNIDYLARQAEELRSEAKEIMEEARRRSESKLNLAQENDDRVKLQRTRLGRIPTDQESINTAEIRGSISKAQGTNRDVGLVVQRQEHLSRAEDHRKRSKGFTSAMDEIKDRIRSKMESAEMPIEGLELGSGIVVYKGEPFSQASDAQQLRVSCALAMRENARLKVIRIRDGSLLDMDSMKSLDELAKEHDYQVWIEIVDDSGRVGIVIRDGSIVNLEGSVD